MNINEYIEKIGETISENVITFSNGCKAYISNDGDRYSISVNGSYADRYGANHGVFHCTSELGVLIACETIRRIKVGV